MKLGAIVILLSLCITPTVFARDTAQAFIERCKNVKALKASKNITSDQSLMPVYASV